MTPPPHRKPFSDLPSVWLLVFKNMRYMFFVGRLITAVQMFLLRDE